MCIYRQIDRCRYIYLDSCAIHLTLTRCCKSTIVVVAQLLSCVPLCNPMDYSLPGSSVLGFPRQEYGSGLSLPSPGDLPDPGIKSRSPTLQVDSLLSEPPGKPKNTGVGSLSLLQGIFQTQELNQGLLHCKQILNQLSYQGSPYFS